MRGRMGGCGGPAVRLGRVEGPFFLARRVGGATFAGGKVMVPALSFGLALAAVLVAAAVRREVRAAYHGLTLSNGMDVLVSPETYGKILDRFEALGASAGRAGL